MFDTIQMAPSDPILGLSEIYNSDMRNKKINLSIGVYVDPNNNTPILPSVKKAEEWLLNHESSKKYLNIEGIYTFNTITKSLLFHNNENVILENICTIQAPGGTGALRIAAEFIAKHIQSKRIWISSPSWVNHRNIFLSAGLEVCNYSYYDVITHSLNFEKLLESLKNVKKGDIVLFHGCCHNPTGIDPSTEQWKILSEISQNNQWLPLFDFAYQGFADGLEKDLKGLNIFCKNNKELIVCNSYSKTFGLYNERVGACTIVTNNKKNAEHVLSQLRSIIRANYSNPPAHGALIVSTILQNKTLRSMWEHELKSMKEHIDCVRKIFLNALLKNKNSKQNFNFIKKQRGMFCFMGLSDNQVLTLRKKFGIYLVGSGRINLSGLSENNVTHVADSIATVSKKNYHEINVI